jgi:hypothetical protein
MNTFTICKSTGVLFVLCILLLTACKKDDDIAKDSDLKSFSGLVADKDTLYVGQTTDIRAIYEGKGVSFKWTSSAGDLLGSGEKVTYVAAICALGKNIITCKATAGTTSISRSIYVYVQ